MQDKIIEEAANNLREALKRQFNEDRDRTKFRIRMSNIGKPLCQLQMEKAGAKAESPGYAHKMKMIIGDITEVVSIAIMRAAGVNVQSTQKKVTLKLGPHTVEGTQDLEVDNEVYDVKSASSFSFNNKFGGERGSYEKLKEDDPFGYLAQGFGYGEAGNSRFAGWVVVNKETGEWEVCETPENTEDEAKAVLKEMKEKLDKLAADAPFERCFEDEEETYYNKKTGNRTLGITCSYCPYKWACWPDLQHRPATNSKAENPKLKYYTFVDPKYTEEKPDAV